MQQTNVRIELVRYDVDKPKDDLLSSYPLIIRATGYNIDSEIFIYHAISKESPYSGDTFEAIAAPNHLEELPKNKPYINALTNESVPYYRRNQIEVLCRSTKELEKIWKTMQGEVASLVDNYAALQRMKQTEILEIQENTVQAINTDLKSSIGALYAEPATAEDLNANGDIVKPDIKMPGWLPIHFKEFENAPKNAKLFYNMDGHKAIKDLFALGIDRPEIQRLIFNGYDYSNLMYEITKDGIFWKSFSSEDFPEDLNLPQPTKDPWAADYVVGYGSSQPNVISFVNYFSF